MCILICNKHLLFVGENSCFMMTGRLQEAVLSTLKNSHFHKIMLHQVFV